MSTYVISDVHGCFSCLMAMLDKIDFQNSDTLILAGDYFDRGTQNIQIMNWIVNKPQNVIALKGNHDMEFVENISVMESLAKKAGINIEFDLDQAGQVVWYKECKRQLLEAGFGYFDYYGSIGQMLDEGATFSTLKKCSDCFQAFPYIYETKINERRCIIVHAGYAESLENLQLETDYDSLEDFYMQAREDAYLYGGVENGMIIAGHTPTLMPNEVAYNEGEVYRFYDDIMNCIFYDIDCGCSYDSDKAKLACIRIEDEKVFYINSRVYFNLTEEIETISNLPEVMDESDRDN